MPAFQWDQDQLDEAIEEYEGKNNDEESFSNGDKKSNQKNYEEK